MEKERIYVREENLDKIDLEKLKGRNVHLCIGFKKEKSLINEISKELVKEMDEILSRAKAPSAKQRIDPAEVNNRSLIDFVEEE